VFGAGGFHEVRPRRSRRAILQLLGQLLEANLRLSPETAAVPDEPLNLALRRSREIIRPGSLLYLLCDHSAIDQISLPLITALAVQEYMVLLPLHDPMEASLPSSTELEFAQGEQRLTPNSTSTALPEAWAAQHLARQQN